MAALWLRSLSLLFLLVVWWPGSDSMSGPQHLCGSNLVEALFITCGEKGFYESGKRGVEPLLGEEAEPLLGEGAEPLLGLLPLTVGGASAGGAELTLEQLDRMVKRSIVQECCHNPCTYNTLQKYCN